MKTTRDTIQELHQAYCSYTGLKITLDMSREQTWYWWQKKGFTVDDLRTVIRYIQRQIHQQKRNPGALKFSNLIGNYDLFEEDLAMANAEARARSAKFSGDKASVLRATGRSDSAPSPGGEGRGEGGSRTDSAVPARDIVHKLTRDPAAAQAAFNELQKLKNSL